MRRLVPTLVLLLATGAVAQTYTPKAVRYDASPGIDVAEARRVAALPEGQPLSKQQIEAALGRLADTGLFTDIHYTVNADALTIKLTGAPATALVPVRFANFVWFKPGELDALLRERVPAYDGKLPAAGKMADQARDVLVSALVEKGITGDGSVPPKVELSESAGAAAGGYSVTALTFTVIRPAVVVHELTLSDAPDAIHTELEHLKSRLRGETFDVEDTSTTLRESVGVALHDRGFLDATVTNITTDAPVRDHDRFEIDIHATVVPGALYTIASISILNPDPLTPAELQKASEIAVHDPAGSMKFRLARDLMEKTFQNHGFLDAAVADELRPDASTHTVAYTFRCNAGPVYRFEALDVSALPAETADSVRGHFVYDKGAIAGEAMNQAIFRAVLATRGNANIRMRTKRNSSAHTVTLIIDLKPS